LKDLEMGLISWIIIGGLAGWISTKIVKPKKPKGCFTGILLGIVGAFVGGLIMSLIGGTPVTGFNFYSLFVATLGAVVLIWLARQFGN
jgi:uncharacterized membrane protein YeaQ/YmgE (transglycosylase-associated protein family)